MNKKNIEEKNNVQKKADISFIQEVEKALEEEQFLLYLLPKFNFKTDRLCGAEVLVRWKHPEKGLMMPKDFLSQCVSCGVMNKMDYYIWEHACMILAEWKASGHRMYPLSVKVSMPSLYHSQVRENINGLLGKYQIPREYLELEIEEDSCRADIYQAQDAINRLHKSGFTILLDDFSYGCSSISALNQINVDVLKVDMKFFSSCSNTGRSEIILASIIKSVNWTGMSVLAECVETQQQRDFAEASGCDYVQGFFYAKPLSQKSFEDKFFCEEYRKSLDVELEKRESPKHNMTILVIDDSEMECALLEKYLKDSYHIHLCENAEMGLAYLAKNKSRVQLILIDYMMPGMNGMEFLKYCQNDEALSQIPKIMITSNDRPQDQLEAFHAGAYDYLTKPLVPELVRVRIRHAMELNKKLQASEHEKIEYKHQAERDKATGVFNKSTFQSYVQDHMAENPDKMHALLIIDIDNFKFINDSYGHLQGDNVIKLIAQELSANFRTSDFVGRFGGDEFTVFMTAVPGNKMVRKKIEYIVHSIAKQGKMLLDINVSVSIGIAFSRQNDNFDILFDKADQALYEAKNTGKGKFVLFNEG